MTKQRLIVFCSEIEADLDRVRRALADSEDQRTEGAQLARTKTPQGLADAGWMAVAVHFAESERSGEIVPGELEAITRLFARVLKDGAVGVLVHPAGGQARASYCSPGMFPRATDGDSFHVIRQAASWLEADADSMVRYFNAPAQKNDLAQAVDLSALFMLEEPSAPAGLDEDDRFVEAKLKSAHELMQRYLGNRK
ncbi:MAG: hypothetical protein ACT4TC_26660 [Myxococcaceae bacterium]